MLVVHQCLLWHLLILQGVESCTQCSPHPWLPFSKSLLGHSSKCSLWGTKFLFWEVKYGEVLLLNQVFVLFSKGSCKHGVGSKQVHTKKKIYIYIYIFLATMKQNVFCERFYSSFDSSRKQCFLEKSSMANLCHKWMKP